MSKLDRYGRSWNTLDDLSTLTFDSFHKACLWKKTGDMNVQPCNYITTTNEPKSLVKDISCDSCKCRFDGQYYI